MCVCAVVICEPDYWKIGQWSMALKAKRNNLDHVPIDIRFFFSWNKCLKTEEEKKLFMVCLTLSHSLSYVCVFSNWRLKWNWNCVMFWKLLSHFPEKRMKKKTKLHIDVNKFQLHVSMYPNFFFHYADDDERTV